MDDQKEERMEPYLHLMKRTYARRPFSVIPEHLHEIDRKIKEETRMRQRQEREIQRQRQERERQMMPN
jgi:hypothetical protein